MKTFLLTISSPDGNLFCGEVTKLSVRGTEGDLAVMAGHIPFITAVKAGACKIEMPDEIVKNGEIDSGLLTVSAEQTTLLCGKLTWKQA